MARVEVRLPQLSMGMSDADIMEWLVGVGDRVAEAQEIVEVQTAKVAVAIPSPSAGVVVEIVAETGSSVDVHEVLCVLKAPA